jgi:hypothetical protein
MQWQQSQNKSSGEMDEHNQPTEPMMSILLAPSAATIADGLPVNADDDIPMPQPYERPFPYQNIQNAAFPHSPYGSSQPAVYPVLPPLPTPASDTGGNRPPGGVTSASDRSIQTTGARFKHKSIPLLVGMFFVVVQLLLLVRFVLKLFALAGSAPWVSLIYGISSIFVLPFRLLLQNILPFSNVLELYTLLAILVYGLLSRFLVRFLKALLRSS